MIMFLSIVRVLVPLPSLSLSPPPSSYLPTVGKLAYSVRMFQPHTFRFPSLTSDSRMCVRACVRACACVCACACVGGERGYDGGTMPLGAFPSSY
jgi:hypothetical protein